MVKKEDICKKCRGYITLPTVWLGTHPPPRCAAGGDTFKCDGIPVRAKKKEPLLRV